QNYPIAPPHAVKPQGEMTQSSVQRQVPYNMGSMAHSLPQVPFRHGQYPYPNQQRYQMTNSPPAMQHMPQFMGHQVPVQNQGYYVQQPQMMQYYGGHIQQPQAGATVSSRQNMAYYPNQMMMNQQSPAYYYPPTSQYVHSNHPMTNTMMPGQYMSSMPSANDTRNTFQSTPNRLGNPSSPPNQGQNSSREQPLVKSEPRHGPDEAEKRQTPVRGPPRKPRQSGHAIWVGNLPPQTNLMSLVYHVCKEASGLESLFLISKSNCAFANFKDEETCVAAQQKLHDSKFQSVRLVSRLRKSTVEGATGVTAPTGPAVVTNSAAKNEQSQESQQLGAGMSTSGGEQASAPKQNPLGEIDMTTQKDKFFILKSLTVEDLELSVRTGIWATQSHNEEILNEAFKTADSVYLVFSANKSGEYFGYARMTSQINEDPAAAIEFAPKTVAASDLDLPKAIPTEATEHAPKGRIIDDSARGTIFWEAERDEADNTSDTESVSSDIDGGAEEEPTKTWGKPFKLEWLSTTQLPFYRTRGLRNPWNSNREVKIARDGTEIEPSVGRRLIGLFNRVQSPGPVTAGMQLPMAMVPGFAPM
ncbi:YT521-B-like domain-containing protein, partial [Dactylonectria macrodidyma]